MARLAYVNGRYLPHAQACVHIEDRGFQFADGVYEVIAIRDGYFVDRQGHMARLERSLRELQIAWPMSKRALDLVMAELVRRNRIDNGLLYLQVTRGIAPRDFRFPQSAKSTLVMTARKKRNLVSREQVTKGVAVITIPDIRWLRRDIKSVALLPQVLGKQQAVEAGAFEAWMVDSDGLVTEGCSSNAWIVTAEGTLVTRHPNHEILNGVTRLSVLKIIEEQGIGVDIRPFSVDEAYRAREAFMTSASSFLLPITRIDGRAVGHGMPGPLAQRLRSAYVAGAGGADL